MLFQITMLHLLILGNQYNDFKMTNLYAVFRDHSVSENANSNYTWFYCISHYNNDVNGNFYVMSKEPVSHL